MQRRIMQIVLTNRCICFSLPHFLVSLAMRHSPPCFRLESRLICYFFHSLVDVFCSRARVCARAPSQIKHNGGQVVQHAPLSHFLPLSPLSLCLSLSSHFLFFSRVIAVLSPQHRVALSRSHPCTQKKKKGRCNTDPSDVRIHADALFATNLASKPMGRNTKKARDDRVFSGARRQKVGSND
ncbi:hypothetical protein BC940DRAFT_147198 [Gongronella butleri]|nr:hypothetical protein BC940DRAFT_147198 [Gongronella butleri]